MRGRARLPSFCNAMATGLIINLAASCLTLAWPNPPFLHMNSQRPNPPSICYSRESIPHALVPRRNFRYCISCEVTKVHTDAHLSRDRSNMREYDLSISHGAVTPMRAFEEAIARYDELSSAPCCLSITSSSTTVSNALPFAVSHVVMWRKSARGTHKALWHSS
ncbi:hypothetical protein FB567DRAFT_56093 [Paraphoma chrysanthemicola]|uniref:Uncharacterized protein n=1 Tax=Paraphoma chrysanthemicola TaxID=798071 RepID=A0A8K0VXZ6_9PLEO|nr:hypothetical protein FB567DRAFT_56093 [Paraphoma chrysanthemicola]